MGFLRCFRNFTKSADIVRKYI